jgi:subtilisin-like proprotein convertase family protein
MGDIGRLDYWGLKIDFDNKDEMVTADAQPNIAIPDFNMTGIQSAIKIEKSGKLKGISVDVDITHTHTGDILIELISPAGQHVLLKSSTGLSGINIIETYSEVKTPNLKVLMDKEIKGNWILHVCDVAGMDVGTLNRWALKILK